MEDPAIAEHDPAHACTSSALRLALDDFGSGYSSLLSPARHAGGGRSRSTAPSCATCPKPRGIGDRHGDPAASRQALGRTTVAEGVETEAQRALSVDEGCQLAQGFLLGRPLPPEGIEELLAAAAAASAT